MDKKVLAQVQQKSVLVIGERAKNNLRALISQEMKSDSAQNVNKKSLLQDSIKKLQTVSNNVVFFEKRL